MCPIIYIDKTSIEKIMGALDDIIKVKGIVEYIDMTILQQYNVNIMRNSGCC